MRAQLCTFGLRVGTPQISVDNVHVRYEDETSNPDAPFAVGATLERFLLSTTNEHGDAMFVNRVDKTDTGANPPALLHKAASLRGFGMYAPAGSPLHCRLPT